MQNPFLLILNFIAIQRPAVLLRLLRKNSASDAVSVLDLEDTLCDLTHPEKTPELKSLGRENLLSLAKAEPAIFRNQQIGIRINRLNSPEFEYDLDFLAKISKVGKISHIVGTKVESPKDIRTTFKNFLGARVQYGKFIPIVETCDGLANLINIAITARKCGISHIIYGHCDYSLDAGHWPFLEHDETGFWEIAEQFIRQVEESGISYVHAPILELYDDTLVSQVFYRLCHLCHNPFGMLTLGNQQTTLCDALGKAQSDAPSMIPLRITKAYDQRERVEMALSVKAAFEQHQLEQKGFAIEPRTGKFISPHIYVPATRFLEKAD